MVRYSAIGFVLSLLLGRTPALYAQKGDRPFHPPIPKMWVDLDMASLEVPLANPVGSPKHISADYYYRIPVRPIYRHYTWYAPGKEPPGYWESLKRREPEIIWGEGPNGDKVAPPLNTEADWIKAGEMVFDSAIGWVPLPDESTVRGVFEKVNPPVSKDGAIPAWQLAIRQKGQVEFGGGSCASCHTRVMPDGAVVKGAQGNHPSDREVAVTLPLRGAVEFVRNFERFLYAAPWIDDDLSTRLPQMSLDDIAMLHYDIPPGVAARHGSSPLYPVHVPDLIGVKNRHYLDSTGLQQHRSIVDLMRYAALNQGADFLADYNGFVPFFALQPILKTLPAPDRLPPGSAIQMDRYSDEQLYALALYLYSLEPPPNPNRSGALAERGRKIFDREGCATCHTPPLYTNNKLTAAKGFPVPEDHRKKYDILAISVGTDPNLTMRTRRGTGYYKVPSLKGVWYRSMFGHSGSCATLEDWFDPRRLRDDYVPTGFKPHDAATYAVRGHPYGLSLNPADKTALIAFLKTL